MAPTFEQCQVDHLIPVTPGRRAARKAKSISGFGRQGCLRTVFWRETRSADSSLYFPFNSPLAFRPARRAFPSLLMPRGKRNLPPPPITNTYWSRPNAERAPPTTIWPGLALGARRPPHLLEGEPGSVDSAHHYICMPMPASLVDVQFSCMHLAPLGCLCKPVVSAPEPL